MKRGRASVSLLCVFVVTLAVSAGANTITIFQENFSGATPGPNNSLAGTQFQVTSGAVDIIGVLNGSFFVCVNNPTGNCLDMVGSPGNGAIASVPTLNLIAGDSYTITFGYILQGFATGNTPTSQFTVGLGTFSNVLTAIPAVQDASLSFMASTNQTGVRLIFVTDTAPDSVHGAVLDHIMMTQTSGPTTAPEPGTLSFLALGAGSIAMRYRHKFHD